MDYCKDQLKLLPKRSLWERYSSHNDVENLIFVKKWSTCSDKLVLKLGQKLISSTVSGKSKFATLEHKPTNDCGISPCKQRTHDSYQ